MSRLAIRRAALAMGALLSAGQASAGSAVPPPRHIEPLRQVTDVDDRPAVRSFRSDRYVPVLGAGGLAPCLRRALAASDWVAEYDDRDDRGPRVASYRDEDLAWSAAGQDDFPMGEDFR